MKHRATRFGGFILAVIFLAPVALLPPARAGAARKSIGAVPAPVRLVPAGDDPISVTGLHRYFGTIEIDSAFDGLVLSDVLPLEQYLLGLNEVPRDWPMEALRAQAVAARTYALNTLARPAAGAAATYGFDICASVECQVFSGAEVVIATDGERWREAVSSTEGVAILYGGDPILARYHSTSGGVTLDNPQAFPDEPGYPYLRSVPSPAEQASPLWRWRARFPVGHLERVLREAALIPSDFGTLTEATSVPSRSGHHYPDVVLEGTGNTVRVDAEEIRDAVRETAPALWPSRYPGPATTSSGRLPETLPSNRYDMRTAGGVVRVLGRGWGHGVGMSQWGAYGFAQEGASYEEILTHYYTGVTLAQVATGDVEVGLDWARDEVGVYGAFDVVDGTGEVVVDDALGAWSFAPAGPGAVAIDPPRGYGLPLRVAIIDMSETAEAGEAVTIDFVLSKPARVRIVGYRNDPTIYPAGRTTLLWDAPSTPGTYEITIRASDGSSAKTSRPARLEVVAEEQPAPADRVPPTRPFPWGTAFGVAAALLVLVLAVSIRA